MAEPDSESPDECECMKGNFHYQSMKTVRIAGDFRVEQCLRCGQHWLNIDHEEPAFSKSGAWYCVPIAISLIDTITAENGFTIFASAPWYYAGGSLYKGHVHKATGELRLGFWL